MKKIIILMSVLTISLYSLQSDSDDYLIKLLLTSIQTGREITQNPDEAIMHFQTITYPWLKWGNSPADVDKKKYRVDIFVEYLNQSLNEFPQYSELYDLKKADKLGLKLIENIFLSELKKTEIDFSKPQWIQDDIKRNKFLTHFKKALYILLEIPDGKSTDIRVVVDFGPSWALDNFIKSFEKKYPNINVDYIKVGDDKKAINSLYLKGETIDIVYSPISGRKEIINNNESFDHREIVDYIKYPNFMHSVPVGFQPRTIMYTNDALLNELGLKAAETYEELLKQREIVQEAGKEILLFSYMPDNDFIFVLYPLFLSRFGGESHIMDLLSGQANYSDNPTKESFDFYNRLCRDGILNKDTCIDSHNESLRVFNSGNVLYFIGESYMSTNITLPQFSLNNFPAIPGERFSNTNTYMFSDGYAITRSATEDPERYKNVKLLYDYLYEQEASLVRNYYDMYIPLTGNIDNTVENKHLVGFVKKTNLLPNITYFMDYKLRLLITEKSLEVFNGNYDIDSILRDIKSIKN